MKTKKSKTLQIGDLDLASPFVACECCIGCLQCGELPNTDRPTLLRCTRCKMGFYCSQRCQKQHWKLHKHECRSCETHPICKFRYLYNMGYSAYRHSRPIDGVRYFHRALDAYENSEIPEFLKKDRNGLIFIIGYSSNIHMFLGKLYLWIALNDGKQKLTDSEKKEKMEEARESLESARSLLLLESKAWEKIVKSHRVVVIAETYLSLQKFYYTVRSFEKAWEMGEECIKFCDRGRTADIRMQCHEFIILMCMFDEKRYSYGMKLSQKCIDYLENQEDEEKNNKSVKDLIMPYFYYYMGFLCYNACKVRKSFKFLERARKMFEKALTPNKDGMVLMNVNKGVSMVYYTLYRVYTTRLESWSETEGDNFAKSGLLNFEKMKAMFSMESEKIRFHELHDVIKEDEKKYEKQSVSKTPTKLTCLHYPNLNNKRLIQFGYKH